MRELFWTLPISRVLSWTAIYLCLASPQGSKAFALCHPQIYVGQTNLHTVLLRIRFTANLRYRRSGWALTSPFHPYLPKVGGLFLLHFLGSRLRLTLSVILPYEARTFLTVIPFGNIPRGRLAKFLSIISQSFYYVKESLPWTLITGSLLIPKAATVVIIISGII